MERVEVQTRIGADAGAVWDRVTTKDGINDELMPVMRMTMPGPLRGRTLADITPGQHVGRSWMLLLGVVPFDYDDITIARIEPGHFLEQSTMLSLRRWEHERTIRADGDAACVVSDRLGFEPRALLAVIPGMTALLRVVVERLFRHRHRRLARHFASRRFGETGGR
jgi:ligand-binding SRPBCC domain-containing protein